MAEGKREKNETRKSEPFHGGSPAHGASKGVQAHGRQLITMGEATPPAGMRQWLPNFHGTALAPQNGSPKRKRNWKGIQPQMDPQATTQ